MFSEQTDPIHSEAKWDCFFSLLRIFALPTLYACPQAAEMKLIYVKIENARHPTSHTEYNFANVLP